MVNKIDEKRTFSALKLAKVLTVRHELRYQDEVKVNMDELVKLSKSTKELTVDQSNNVKLYYQKL